MRPWVQTGPLSRRRKGKVWPTYHFHRIARSLWIGEHDRVQSAAIRSTRRNSCLAIAPGASVEPCSGLRPAARQLYPFLGGPMTKRIFACAMSVLLLAIAGWADDKEKDEDRLKNAGTVLTEILNIPDDIPQDLLDKADCVVVFPSVLKAAFVVGGSYGRGAMTCRTGEYFNGPWGAPSMMALEGGSVGFQIGGQATDFVLLVMNDRGAK